VKLPDVNLLLHAVNASAPQHAVAREALHAAYADDRVGMAWAALLGFLRLSTRAGIFAQPLTIDQALEVVRAWLDHPAVSILNPTPGHGSVLARLLLGLGQGGPLVSDAHLAALAIEHGAELLTFDRDFARFAGLRWKQLD
jgi:toxin-antitoxin system PIN domain toxin